MNTIQDVPRCAETTTTKLRSTSYVRSKPKIHLSQQQASLPGASWKGMVPLIFSAVSSPGANWKVMVPLILSAGNNINNHSTTGHNQHVYCIHINYQDTSNVLK